MSLAYYRNIAESYSLRVKKLDKESADLKDRISHLERLAGSAISERDEDRIAYAEGAAELRNNLAKTIALLEMAETWIAGLTPQGIRSVVDHRLDIRRELEKRVEREANDGISI